MVEQTGRAPVRDFQIQLAYDKLGQDYGPAVEAATKRTVIELQMIDPSMKESDIVATALQEMRQAEGSKAVPSGARVPESETDLMNLLQESVRRVPPKEGL
jgi:hypothetical protein